VKNQGGNIIMNQEMIYIPALITIILALTSLIVMPIVAIADSKDPLQFSEKSSDAPEGSACDLPPVVEIEGKGAEFFNKELPPMGKRKIEDIKTATFAMG
jgi:hypothetical protein